MIFKNLKALYCYILQVGFQLGKILLDIIGKKMLPKIKQYCIRMFTILFELI